MQTALEQIETKQYDAELLARRIEKERIRHYGFAFDGKQVLIGLMVSICFCILGWVLISVQPMVLFKS